MKVEGKLNSEFGSLLKICEKFEGVVIDEDMIKFRLEEKKKVN